MSQKHTVEKMVDVAVANFVFSGLSIEKMNKIPKWLLENMENNKPHLYKALTEAHQAGRDEAVLDKEIDLTTAALMGMLTAGFPEELANKHAILIAKSIMRNPSVEREALQDNK